jgi:predicted HNH restriction endonuclease
MKWKEDEILFLKENYNKRIPMEEVCKKLNRSKRSVQHKAVRIDLSRKSYKFNIPPRESRTVIDKRYYEKHKETRYKEKMKRINNLKKELKIKLGGKCSKCGYNKAFCALDFHHNQGDKEGNVSRLIKDFSKQKALKEIEKCILLCANCHRELHNTDP